MSYGSPLQVVQGADHIDDEVRKALFQIFGDPVLSDDGQIRRVAEIKDALMNSAAIVCAYVPLGQGRNECIKMLVEVNRKCRDAIALGGGGY